MRQFLRLISLKRQLFSFNNVILFSTQPYLKQITRPALRKQITTKNKIDPYGWFMLIIPAASFGLGIWQIQRKQWKENLIVMMQERMKGEAVELPDSLEELKGMEYQKVHVRGTFLHDKEVFIGPRSLIDDGLPESHKLPNSRNVNSSRGYLVVTPFKLADRDATILVNRGWVSQDKKPPSSRTEGQLNGVIDLYGIVRLGEQKPSFAIKHSKESNFLSRDLEAICEATGASPVFIDQTLDDNVVYPIGGQTRVQLRNEHLSYILTWFSLGGATAYMWFKRFVLK
ncbi:SURF1-like protein [Anthonomus grandis grandis]|uniref:SURF1-like protein n=1 Tax=Anthonomus grandis grandis TaxID=2921223 RepID=UPI00216698EE|nr:SURF1-like protein [Anthonomus grandis grandis]